MDACVLVARAWCPPRAQTSKLGYHYFMAMPMVSKLPPPEQAIIFATIGALLVGLFQLQRQDPAGTPLHPGPTFLLLTPAHV